MPKIPNLIAFGIVENGCCEGLFVKMWHAIFVIAKYIARNCKQMQLSSRCVECDNILDNLNYCECCGLETKRQLRITKAELSNLFPKNQAAPESFATSTMQSDKSQD